MFNQGGGNSQSGMHSNNAMSHPQFGQLPPPPPPPHSFPQGPHRPPGPPRHLPPHPGQLSVPPYHHQGQQASNPPVPGMHNVRMPSTSQPYVHSPGIRGNLPMPHGYGNVGQQNSQHPSYFGQGRPPPPPPAAGSPGQPPGSLPPSASQCHTVFNAPVHHPTQQTVGMQGFRQIPRLPPPPPPPLRTSDSSGNSVQSTPSSATITPCQPSISSSPSLGFGPVPTDSNSHFYSGNDGSENSGLSLAASSSVAEVSQVKHDTPTCESNLNSKHENDSDGGGVKNDLPLGPPGLSSHLVSGHKSYSPSDSDMEMEDDITHPEYEQPVEHQIEGQVHGQDIPYGEVVTKADDPATAGCALDGDREISKAPASAASEHTHSPYNKHGERDYSFELLQDCSSDDNLEDNKESLQMDVCHRTDSPPMAVGSRNLPQGSMPNVKMDVGSKSPFPNEKDDKLSELHMPNSAHELSSCLEREVVDISSTPIARGTTAKQIDTELETEVSAIHATSTTAHLEEGASGTTINAASSVKSQKDRADKDTTFVSKIQKIDKYGRLVREGANDSDSEDSWDAGKRRRGSSRSRSRSRSPVERRRRRRSPIRKRDRRSRSRSWSPRNRRSRSRSPSFRHIGEFNGNRRQDKGICYDFRRGKCYRGASCRYRHYDHENNDRSRPGRKHPHSDVPPSSKSSITRDEMKRTYKESDHDRESMSPEKHMGHDEHASHITAGRVGHIQEKGSTLGASSQYVISGNSNQLPETSRGAEVKVMGTSGVEENLTNPTILKAYNQSYSEPSDTVHARQADQQPHQMDNSLCDSSADKISNSPSKNSSQTSTYPSLLAPAGVNVCVTQQRTSFLTQSCSLETGYMMPHQISHFSATQNSSWASFQPSPLNLQSDSQSASTGTALPGVLQFQQSHLPQKNGLDSMTYSRPYSTELPSYSQAGQLPPGLPPVQEPSQPLSHAQDIKPLPQCTSSVNHPYFQQQQPPGGLLDSVPESANSLSGKIASNFPPDANYNPYASNFGDKYDHPLSLIHSSVNRKGDDIGAGPDLVRHAGQILPHSGGDLYDPLFDSIEPISKSSQKLDDGQKQEPSDGPSGLNKPLFAEAKKKKELCSSGLEASVDNEEFGETADAEVGDVDDGSQSSFNVAANTDMGEVEIDQIKSPGKKKKTKDSRSMKLFRVSLAEFVKGVLKPSWRQGNMSKEAFKTVVKKTVDKVSGAMQSHHIPKSQAKINHYIDSSERKLTKLVMGYVDKYAKG